MARQARVLLAILPFGILLDILLVSRTCGRTKGGSWRANVPAICEGQVREHSHPISGMKKWLGCGF